MKKRQEIQRDWENIVRQGINDYSNLNDDEKVWFNIEQIINGGLVEHYVGDGAKYNKDLIEALEKLDVRSVKKLFLEINSFFEKEIVPEDIDIRNEIIYMWNYNKKNILDKNERLFWNSVKELEHKLIIYINNKILDK